jgi:hypothetical protein
MVLLKKIDKGSILGSIAGWGWWGAVHMYAPCTAQAGQENFSLLASILTGWQYPK